jgi:hypothetical protein
MKFKCLCRFECDPGGARTLDPLIKSQLLSRHRKTAFFNATS